ncbi:MAG: hypothetical protein NTU41_07740 [Chloroflexi bacterium]|nr:hypothetical protein [Chloroflexota bacterium]
MDDMKSAFEIAMEKAAKLEKPSKEEALEWKHIPEGQKLAAEYLKEGGNLAVELGKFDDQAKRFVTRGAQEVLLRGINLPANDVAKANNKKAMEGIRTIKRDKTAVENVYSKMRRVFEHYEKEGEQQRRQAYEMLKQNFQMKLQQAMQQQGLPPGTKINVETQPQFQEEWHRTAARLDSQYSTLLDEYKQEIEKIR